jgi:hypothetical protein
MPGSPGTTWSLLALEAGIAISALWPWRAFAQGLHHGLLLMFCLTTYAFAPVAGFGWLLLIMGLAMRGTSTDASPHLRRGIPVDVVLRRSAMGRAVAGLASIELRVC